jgi:hypothetical protein
MPIAGPWVRPIEPGLLATTFVSGFCLAIDGGIEIACPMLSEEQYETHERTPQPTSSERHKAHKPARHTSVILPRFCPRPDRGETSNMITIDAPPGELNVRILSSILNLVCPQCGGRMSEYQCEGRCGRNWLPEWEWANRRRKALCAGKRHPVR